MIWPVTVRIDSPIFLVGPPAAGTDVLYEALARADGVLFPRPGAQPLVDALADGAPETAADGHRLDASDATPELAAGLREAISSAAADREGRGPAEAKGGRFLDRTPRNSLRVPFLDAVFPDATFLYVHRDPRESLADLLGAWRSGKFVTHSKLPGWPGPPWSLLLVPGWRDLAGRPLPEIVA